MNVSKVNTLNQEVMKEFSEVIKKVEADPAVKAVVLISSKTDCFIAGADIRLKSLSVKSIVLKYILYSAESDIDSML